MATHLIGFGGVGGGAVNPPVADFFVDATLGNDSNAGTSIGAPWQTIAKVNGYGAFSAGHTIAFKRGETWREGLIPPTSGSSGSPITFTAYGSGDRPAINGSIDVLGSTGNWTSISGDRWTRTISVTDSGVQKLLYIDFGLGGEDIQNPQTSQANVNAAGEWFLSGSTLTVYNNVDNPATDFTTLEINDHSQSIYINGRSYISCNNLAFTKGRFGLRITSSNNIIATDCLSNYNGTAGVFVSGTSNTVTLTDYDSVDNGVFDPANPGGLGQHGINIADSATTVTINGGNWSRNAEDGLLSDTTGAGTVLTLLNATAENNYEGPIDIKNGNWLIEDGTFIGDPTTGEIGLRLHNATIDVISNRNYYEGGGSTAFERALGIANDGKITSTRDTFVGSAAGSRGVWLESTTSRASSFTACLIISSGSRSACRIEGTGTGHVLSQCTIRASGTAQAFDLDDTATATVKNCIIHAEGANAVNIESGATMTVDGNLYERTGTTGFVVDGGTTYDESDIGGTWDTNGTSGDPQYINEGADDYSPTNGGPADGAGVTGLGVTNDLEGVAFPSPPDIGCLIARTP